MESQDNTNPQLETPVTDGNSALPQTPTGENTNGETPEAKLETSADVPGEIEPESSVTTSQQDENSTSEKSVHTESETEPKNEVITPDSSSTSENIGDSQNSSSDFSKSEINNRDDEPVLKEKEIGLIDQGKKIFKGLQRVVGMSPSNEEISKNLVKVLNWMRDISKNNRKIYIEDIDTCWFQTKEAWDLIKTLLDDKRTDAQKLQAKKQENERLSDELNQRISYYRQQIDQKNDEIGNLTKEKQDLEERLEESRTKLVSALASANLNTGTHYDGTSDRPQHHVLTGEYKTLKEQHLDPLANSLFTLMATSKPQLKQQRREKVNDIKADISAIVLIGGQAMMRGESTSSAELPSEKLNKMLEFFNQELGIFDPNQSPQVSELLTKAANVAQGKGQYSVPGKWQEDDFKQAIRELTEKLCQKLGLNFTTLNSDIQTEIQKAINNALIFIERTNLAEPAALLSLDKEGMTFNCDFYEAAKGYEDEGKVTKVIYPAYIVDLKAKVKAIVLTEPSTITPQTNPDPVPSSTGYETLSSTGSPSNPPASVIKSLDITEDEKEKIISQGILKGKRETLIKNVRNKWIDVQFYYGDKNSDNAFLEKLANITNLETIEQLEDEFIRAYQLNQFKEKVTDLVC